MYVCVCVCICVCINVCICVYMCICVYVYMYMYIDRGFRPKYLAPAMHLICTPAVTERPQAMDLVDEMDRITLEAIVDHNCSNT